jgi:hypothetical protein
MAASEITKREKDILRELAWRVRQIAAEPDQQRRKQVWFRINGLRRGPIPVLLRVNSLYLKDVVPDIALRTSDGKARDYERRLRLRIWQWENIDDDNVTEPIVEYGTVLREPRLIQPNRDRPDVDGLGAYHVTPVIETEADIDKIIEDPSAGVDWDATERNREWVEDVFGGILEPVRARPGALAALFDYVCLIRGMDNLFIDMIERPEWLDDLMRRLWDVQIAKQRTFEREGGLVVDNTYQHNYNGGLSYTDELPADGFDPAHVRLKDTWAISVAQSSVSISPEMHERFITRYEREYHALFGLTTLACCEPIDRKMHLHRTLPNLRRISICAWNDFARAAEAIGTDYIYSIKPTAVPISRPDWDIGQDEAHLRNILTQSCGCHVEIINQEIATCLGQPERLARWCRMARRVAEEFGE